MIIAVMCVSVSVQFGAQQYCVTREERCTECTEIYL